MPNPVPLPNDLVRRLETLSASPRSLVGPRNWLNGALLLSDYVASVPPAMSRWTSKFRTYPEGFQKVRFPSLDGTELSGWLGTPRESTRGPRPGLILIPGLFTSKDNTRIRARSVRILREWGFHILTLDLRGIGDSERKYSTPGVKEAQDIEAAVAFMKGLTKAQPVHIYAESLAAAAVLVAAGRAGAEGRPLVDGLVLSVSPFGEPGGIIERFSGPVWFGDRDFWHVKTFFKLVLRMTGTGHADFRQYVEASARSYGTTYADLVRESTALHVLARSQTRVLVLHSEDDLLVPVEDARDLARACDGNEQVRVWILPWGNHCLYEMAEPDWYWSMLQICFGAHTA